MLSMMLKFLLPLILVLSGIAYFTVPAVEYVTNRWFVRELDARSKLVSDALQETLSPLLALPNTTAIKKKRIMVLSKMTENERVLAIGYCNQKNVLEFSTPLFPADLKCQDFEKVEPHSLVIRELKHSVIHVTSAPLSYTLEEQKAPGTTSIITNVGKILIVHDMSFARHRAEDTKKYLFMMFLGIGLITAIIGVFIARWSMKGWIRSVRSLVTGARMADLDSLKNKEFLPIIHDVKNLIRELETNRAIRDELQLSWTPQTLKEILSTELSGDEIIVVSNREPYIHIRDNGKIRIQFPASGLVTAMEPVVRACSGIWIAHGNGSADREVVDSHDRVKVPPGKNEYEIHRVWLTPEEEQGYYYGFANEGLWPLCHMAHTRPTFRQADWEYYQRVNQKFAAAVIEDARSDNPVVLVQDYHFALVPRMIRNKLPNATIITFWHVPWPNAEAFGICPWREELLDGLLGSSIMGFHIRFHRNNFIETVDRFLESRIDREYSSISYLGGATLVRSYPISIEWPPRLLVNVPTIAECGALVRRRDNIGQGVAIGLGVDRLDYTKGIVERFRAVERFLEEHPQWVGKFSFIQIAAPSRESIAAYKAFEYDVREMAKRVNTRFGSEGYEPIILKVQHHNSELVYEYMRAAHLCFVSSLHDGMNLVAKEYIATREDELGVLILSMFAGASRELSEALIVNPYDIEQCVDAILSALSMSEREQRERMHAMRSFVKEFNIYRWAGKMLLDAAIMRRKSRFLAKFARDKVANSRYPRQ